MNQIYFSGRNNPVKNAIKTLLQSCDKDQPFEKWEERLGANVDGSDSPRLYEYQNVHMLKSIPEHVLMMINNMPELIRPMATDVIQKMIDNGDIVSVKWVNRPPIEQTKDATGHVNYYMPPMDLGWPNLNDALKDTYLDNTFLPR